MQNVEEGAVTIAGPGLVVRSSENYGPGEYKKFKNVVITPEGTIKKRRPVTGQIYTDGTWRAEKFIGNIGARSVAAGYNYTIREPILWHSRGDHYMNEIDVVFSDPIELEKSEINTKVATTGMPMTGTINYYIEGMFQYGDWSYAIMMVTDHKPDSASPIYVDFFHTFVILQTSNFSRVDADTPITSFSFTDDPAAVNLIETTVKPYHSAAYYYSSWKPKPKVPLAGYMMHKDRLLVAIDDTLYFSKAADPATFATASDGGFVKFPGKNIKKIVAVADTIYVIFDTSISMVTYNQGPNVDLQVRVISQGVGGEDAVLYGDTVYVIGINAIYTVNGTNVTKFFDLNTLMYNPIDSLPPSAGQGSPPSLAGGSTPSIKIAAWDDALYFFQRNLEFAGNEHVMHVKYTSAPGPLYRLDLNNGCLSEFTFENANAAYTLSDCINTLPDQYDTDDKFFLLGRQGSGLPKFFYFAKNQAFWYDLNGKYLNTPNFGIDSFCSDFDTVKVVCTIPIDIEIANFSPDRFKYYIRKYRSIMVQGDFPTYCLNYNTANPQGPELEMVISAGIPATLGGAAPDVTSVLLVEPLTGVEPNREVVGLRYALNQRAKDLTINIRTISTVRTANNLMTNMHALNNGNKQAVNALFELVDITTLWTPTRRGPTGYSGERA